MALLAVPRELLDAIALFVLGAASSSPVCAVPPPRDLLNLAQTCGLLRAVCAALIYRDVTTAATAGKLERLLADFPAIAAHVRTLTVHAPEYRHAETLKTRSLAVPYPDRSIARPPLPPPYKLAATPPAKDAVFPPHPLKNLDLSALTNPPAPPTPASPTPWIYSVLGNCTALTQLVLTQPRTRKYADVPGNFHTEFLAHVAAASLRTIRAVTLRDFRMVGFLTQFAALLRVAPWGSDGGGGELQELRVERLEMANSPSVQEGERVARRMQDVVAVLDGGRALRVKVLVLDAPVRRPAVLERVVGELLARAVPGVEVVELKTGADVVYAFMKGCTSALREVRVEVGPLSFRPVDDGRRADFCEVLRGRSKGITKLALECAGELRVCQQLLMDAEWLVLKEMTVKCAKGCEGANADELRKCIRERGLERGRISVKLGKAVCDNYKSEAPVEMFGQLQLEEGLAAEE